MESNFWHQKWAQGDIGFHEKQVNPALVKHFSELNLVKGRRIFLPLCGKTLDIKWLLTQGYRIVGAELSSMAINELFQSLDLTPTITPVGALTRFSARNIDIWVGDIFDLSSDLLGAVDAIYDRAALVALPENMRKHYTEHLVSLTHKAPQLLITYNYDQLLYDGPPFSVSEQELQRHYDEIYKLKLLAKTQIVGGFNGRVDAAIEIRLLQKSKL